MGGMVRLLATIGAKGASKLLKRRKQLGGDKAAKSAAAFVKRRKQISDSRKKQRMSKEGKDAIKFGAITAAGVGASAGIKRNKPVKKRDGGSVRNFGTPSMMEMMTPRERAEHKRKKMKELGLRPSDLEKKPGKRRPTVKKMALGGEAAESVGKATVERSQREIRRKEVDDMLDRVYGKKSTIKPKKKPKKPTKVKTPKIVKDLRAAGGIKSSDAIKAAIKAMKSKK